MTGSATASPAKPTIWAAANFSATKFEYHEETVYWTMGQKLFSRAFELATIYLTNRSAMIRQDASKAAWRSDNNQH
tara:strand:+ start:2572 stop:2799 length:228 start_codon:yes stop_codon:yes gene_type:complete